MPPQVKKRPPKKEKDEKGWQKKQKRKVCIFCKDRIEYVDYKDVGMPAQVRLRPRQDPRAPRDGQLLAAPARRRDRGQERPRDGPAALLDAMKVILQKPVDKLGVPGDIVEVADGYARNYLMPRGMAVKATKGGVKHVDSLKRAHTSR